MILKNTKFSFLVLMSMPLLAGCSTVIDGSTQQVSFKSVGAADSSCDIQIGTNDYRYSVHPPQTIWIQKSRSPMYISCTAPGNRMQNATIESSVAGSTYLNTLTAGATAAVDATTGAMFMYPNEVIIDFTSSLAKAHPLPAYENRGALDPRAQGIEYMGPDTPALDGDKALSDRYRNAYAESARLDAEAAAAEAERARRINEVEGGFYGDKTKQTSDKVSDLLKPDQSSLELSPLSEAAPAVAPSKSVVASPLSQSDTPTSVVPQINHQLGKPIFPSSTSF